MTPSVFRKGPRIRFAGVAALLVYLGPPLLFVLAVDRYQPVESGWRDLLAVMAVAIVVTVLVWRRSVFTKEAASVLPRISSDTIWSGAGVTLWFGFGVAGVLLFLNGALDRGKATEHLGIITRQGCARHCSWDIGLVEVPGKSITPIVSRSENERAHVGDSVDIEIKPGFLGRAWLQSLAMHRKR
jgi:hypothetical protein